MHTNILDILLEEGLLGKKDLEEASRAAASLGVDVEEYLLEKNLITEESYLRALAIRSKTRFARLAGEKIDEAVVRMLPAAISRRLGVVPITMEGDKVIIAVSKPLSIDALDEIRVYIKQEIRLIFAPSSDITSLIRRSYKGTVLDKSEIPEEVSVEVMESLEGGEGETGTDEAFGDKIVKEVNNIIYHAYHNGASDVHIEPSRRDVLVRFRVDGFLEEFCRLSKNMQSPVISRLKVMGNMDVAEKRMPQDGRVRLSISNKEVDLRIATYPTVFGEAAAIRILSEDQLITLERLGFLEDDLNLFKEIITKPYGIFLVTGPTGSGKSTTLYAALMEINSKEKHILSIEDPVEHEIPNVDQQQVNVKAGVTFATALRAMLREDPDVIMVGEIRDQETAEIALRAAMTGHLVFSTLHTNTAVGAVYRLVDLGVEPYLVASTLIGVMSQRLVRRICEECKEEVPVDTEKLGRLGSNVVLDKMYKGKGCSACRNSGYKGRIGIFELIHITEDMRVLINKMMPEVRLREKANAMGYRTMLEDGIEKVRLGLTTLDEVLRVTS